MNVRKMTFRIPEYIMKEFDSISYNTGESKNSLVRQILTQTLVGMKESEMNEIQIQEELLV